MGFWLNDCIRYKIHFQCLPLNKLQNINKSLSILTLSHSNSFHLCFLFSQEGNGMKLSARWTCKQKDIQCKWGRRRKTLEYMFLSINLFSSSNHCSSILINPTTTHTNSKFTLIVQFTSCCPMSRVLCAHGWPPKGMAEGIWRPPPTWSIALSAECLSASTNESHGWYGIDVRRTPSWANGGWLLSRHQSRSTNRRAGDLSTYKMWIGYVAFTEGYLKLLHTKKPANSLHTVFIESGKVVVKFAESGCKWRNKTFQLILRLT